MAGDTGTGHCRGDRYDRRQFFGKSNAPGPSWSAKQNRHTADDRYLRGKARPLGIQAQWARAGAECGTEGRDRNASLNVYWYGEERRNRIGNGPMLVGRDTNET